MNDGKQWDIAATLPTYWEASNMKEQLESGDPKRRYKIHRLKSPIRFVIKRRERPQENAG